MAMKRIVVGVDGSEPSKAALAWAADEARLRSDHVLAVLAWTPPMIAAGPWPGMVPIPAPADDEQDAKAALAELVDDVLDHIPKVEVEQRVVHGPPAQALIDAARDAQLLVVGSRGHGGFAGLLLGSVSQQCAQHAACPVVIVRGPETAGR
jgi:nucleotide-binding universal stress UspA family protein